MENLLSELNCIHRTMDYHDVSFIKDKVDLYIVTLQMSSIYCQGKASYKPEALLSDAFGTGG